MNTSAGFKVLIGTGILLSILLLGGQTLSLVNYDLIVSLQVRLPGPSDEGVPLHTV